MNIHVEDQSYPILFHQNRIETFLRAHSEKDTEIALSITVTHHNEHFWNVLRLPDGEHYKKHISLYTNWIIEDYYWKRFQAAHTMPHWLLLFLFSLLRMGGFYRQPMPLVQTKERKRVSRYLNRVLLHELRHYLDHVQGIPTTESRAEAFEEKHQHTILVELE